MHLIFHLLKIQLVQDSPFLTIKAIYAFHNPYDGFLWDVEAAAHFWGVNAAIHMNSYILPPHSVNSKKKKNENILILCFLCLCIWF